MLGSINSKKISYPQIFDKQSLKTYARVASFNFISWSLCRRWYILYTLFSSSNRFLHLHKRRKRKMDADESTFQWSKAWSPSSSDMNFIDSSLWFFLINNTSSPSDADMNNIRNFSFRSYRHKRQLLLPYFSIQTCEKTRVCYICYRVLFEKLIIYCNKQ